MVPFMAISAEDLFAGVPIAKPPELDPWQHYQRNCHSFLKQNKACPNRSRPFFWISGFTVQGNNAPIILVEIEY